MLRRKVRFGIIIELFDQETHQRAIQLYDVDPETIEEWYKYCLEGIGHVPGVDVKV